MLKLNEVDVIDIFKTFPFYMLINIIQILASFFAVNTFELTLIDLACWYTYFNT